MVEESRGIGVRARVRTLVLVVRGCDGSLRLSSTRRLRDDNVVDP